MNHPGEILPLARLAQPHVAVITAVERAHVGNLGGIEAIADEKASILRGLLPGGVAVLPADNPLIARLRDAAGDARIMTFGAARAADVPRPLPSPACSKSAASASSGYRTPPRPASPWSLNSALRRNGCRRRDATWR